MNLSLYSLPPRFCAVAVIQAAAQAELLLAGEAAWHRSTGSASVTDNVFIGLPAIVS